MLFFDSNKDFTFSGPSPDALSVFHGSATYSFVIGA